MKEKAASIRKVLYRGIPVPDFRVGDRMVLKKTAWGIDSPGKIVDDCGKFFLFQSDKGYLVALDKIDLGTGACNVALL